MKRWNVSLTSPKRTIQTELMLAFILIAVIPVTLVNQFYYNRTRAFIEEKAISYNHELVRQTSRQLETILTQTAIVIEQLTSYFVSPELFTFRDADLPEERVSQVIKTENYLKYVRRSFPVIADIYILFEDGSFYTTNSTVDRERLIQKEWITNAFQGQKGVVIIPTHEADYFNINNRRQMPRVISFVKRITLYESEQTEVVIQIDLDYGEIKSIVESVEFDEGTTLQLQNSRGTFIYPGADGQSDKPDRKIDSILISYPIIGADWDIQAYIPEENLYNQLRYTNQIWISILLIVIFFSMGISYVLSREITSPLRKLVNSMKIVGEGSFHSITIKSRNSEIQTLVYSFNLMIDRIDTLMNRIVVKETEKTKAQLQALEAQINPHFLYNTLETIRSIAVQNRVDSIAEICKSLANMFRYSINKKKDIVTLREEVQHIRNYMNIQMHRFGDKISVEYLIDDVLLEHRVFKMILQPVVENSVFHGLETKRSQGHILISAYLENGDIYLQVVDDGVGMEPDLVASLNNAFAGITEKQNFGIKSKSGIGLMNVNSRIKLYYGNEYGLQIMSKPRVETRVQIHIPAI